MSPQVNAAIIAFFAGILITLLGGFISYLTNKSIKLKEWQLILIKEDITIRQKIYSDFLGQANKLLLFSIEEKASSVKELDSIINYFSQIEILATQEVIEQAKKLANYVLDANTQSSNKQNQDFNNIKKHFIEAVKDELSKLRNI
ncbi:hypothetical protein [Nodularia sp. NIES-3585]|uniref:hypothetical protein n=1 Tax=Nodularia sp. NIES-3585 TaxID=1973477 RepID=UPI000B5C432F|nr:hypothetical protein [Nodularia sp. NIES-3585]GAX34133.1 hypothetical protein NIES3585_01320 [Nodularia sp. NIES-3585]